MSKGRYSAEDVARIVWSPDSHQALAREYGCSKELIRQIRCGKVYRELLPDGYRLPPGPGDPSCLQCRHWQDARCDVGFPDPLEEGPGFARDCALFAVEG